MKLRANSRHSRHAVAVLGQMIRISRIERGWSMLDLAERLGVSRDLLHRIEQGDTRCGIGTVFEAAFIVGVPLFDEDSSTLAARYSKQAEKLSLLPKSVHKSRDFKDDF